MVFFFIGFDINSSVVFNSECLVFCVLVPPIQETNDIIGIGFITRNHVYQQVLQIFGKEFRRFGQGFCSNELQCAFAESF